MKKNKSLPRIRFGIALKLDRHSTANLSFLEANEVLNSGFSVFRYDKKMKYPAAELTGHRVTRTPNLIASYAVVYNSLLPHPDSECISG